MTSERQSPSPDSHVSKPPKPVTLITLDERLSVLEDAVGLPPNPLKNFNGTALHESVYGLKTAMDELKETIESWRKALSRRDDALARVGWIIATTLIIALVTGLIAYLGGFRRVQDPPPSHASAVETQRSPRETRAMLAGSPL